jgi:hypothetical protein
MLETLKKGKIFNQFLRAEPGVCAAASPGGGGQRREAFSSAGEQVGDPMAKDKSLGSIGQREGNFDEGKEKETCLCCKRIPGSARQCGSAPDSHKGKCYPGYLLRRNLIGVA